MHKSELVGKSKKEEKECVVVSEMCIVLCTALLRAYVCVTCDVYVVTYCFKTG